MARGDVAVRAMELPPNIFRELAKLIHDESGMVLGPEKAYLVRHRLEPLVREEGLADFAGLVHRLRTRASARLRDALIDAITVKETQFFRDQAYFDAIRSHVMPTIVAALARPGSGRQRARIWSAAASTGQEAYSVAILARESMGNDAGSAVDERRLSILASDISSEAIDKASAGLYTQAEVRRGLSEARLHQHFRRRGELWSVEESLRRMVQFRTFNLLNSPTELGAFDLILCRNVLIYFDDATRRRICLGLCGALHDGGWLALGSAESLRGMEDRLETVLVGKAILYRKPLRAPEGVTPAPAQSTTARPG
jgi:chemotaxis protein methyltransferase CheR